MLAYVPSLERPLYSSAIASREVPSPASASARAVPSAGQAMLAVHRRHRRRLHRHVVDRPAAVGLHRVRLEGGDQAIPARADVDIGEGALAALLAPRRPVGERLLEADELGDPLVVLAVAARLVGGVEDHRPHPFREQRGVHATEVGAVGHADVGQLLVTQGGADHVHVAGRVLGRVVAQACRRRPGGRLSPNSFCWATLAAASTASSGVSSEYSSASMARSSMQSMPPSGRRRVGRSR